MLAAAVKILGEEVLKKIVNKTGDVISNKIFKDDNKESKRLKEDFPELYSNHLNVRYVSGLTQSRSLV